MPKILEWMYDLERFGIKLGVEVMQKMMDLLDHPEQKFKLIHVTGTNGKGSTCAFLASILQEAGYKVGLYTSPHLVRFNERIQINSKKISNKDLMRLAKFLKDLTAKNNLQPTFFEFTTALAFLYFAEQKIDYGVIEVGMGGRLDATNVLQPLISVVTHVDFDHRQHLGQTKLEIAAEKVGIIKKNSLVVTAEKDSQILQLIQEKCAEKQVQLFILNHQQIKPKQSSLFGQKFFFNEEEYKIKLLGDYQLENASLAILTAKLLSEKINLTPEQIKQGLLKTTWLGRLQIIQRKPLIMVDGSHNLEGIRHLVQFLQKIPNKKILVLGIAKDKEISQMVQLLAPLFEEVIITQGNYKPAETSVIAAEVRKYAPNVEEIPTVPEAIKRALEKQGGGLLLFAGSIYMIGDVLKNRNLFKIKQNL